LGFEGELTWIEWKSRYVGRGEKTSQKTNDNTERITRKSNIKYSFSSSRHGKHVTAKQRK